MSGPTLAVRLEPFTTDELLAEVARRERELRAKVEGVVLCNGCRHEQLWTRSWNPPKGFNTCSLGHALDFKMPEEDEYPNSESAGFFRPGGCPDRQEPAPTPEPTRPPRSTPRSAR